MRHTHQEGFNQKQVAFRSNSNLGNRDKFHNIAQAAPIIAGDLSSQLPKTFRMTPGGAITTTMQTSMNTSNQDFIVDQDYHSSILLNQ